MSVQFTGEDLYMMDEVVKYQYRVVTFKESEIFKSRYKIEFWFYGKKSPDLKRSHVKEVWKTI